MAKSNSISSSMIYKTLERYSVMLFQMLVQIVIARILSPSDYGVVAMMTVFIAIASVFTQNGFNRAVVQKKEADDIDYGTALTINTLMGVFFYIVIFIAAPWIADYYHNTDIKTYIRVLALIVPVSSVNAIQIAIANRHMEFASIFKCNLFASIISGMIGVMCALLGLGVWSLIIQNLTSVIAVSILMRITVSWKPRFNYRGQSAREMFSFGWKMMAAATIHTVYGELASLIIGRNYSSSDLAFYSKGKHFPRLITAGIDASMDSVMLSAFSKKQANTKALHALMKKSQNINCYLLFPFLGIFAMVAEPVIQIILTEKWLPCLPFLYIACFTNAFHPISSSQMQSIAAVGRSDVRLKLEFLKKGIGIALLIPAVKYGPFAIAINAAVTSLLSVVINTVACKIVIKYPIKETIKDILPILVVTVIVMVPLYYLRMLDIPPIPQIFFLGLVGFVLYIVITSLLKFYGYEYMKRFIRAKLEGLKKSRNQ